MAWVKMNEVSFSTTTIGGGGAIPSRGLPTYGLPTYAVPTGSGGTIITHDWKSRQLASGSWAGRQNSGGSWIKQQGA